MEEEARVLFAAAELGRADIIGKAIESLTAGSPADASPADACNERQRLVSVIRESDGASALHISSMKGHIDASRALLRLGAAPEVQGTGPLSGKTPWDVATTAVRQVYANELFSQVAQGEEGKVLALLRAGMRADVTDGGSRADTPLHWAAGAGHVSLCSILLENGADLGHSNSEGASALHEASRSGHAGVVSLLLERGANPYTVGTAGAFKDKTPLQVSCSEAVSEALRSPPPPPRSALAAPLSDSQLSEESDATRARGAGVGNGVGRALGIAIGDGDSGTEEAPQVEESPDGHDQRGADRGWEHAAAKEDGEEGGGEAEQKRESGHERWASLGAGVGRDGEGVGGGGRGRGRALPMLWPPPKSCTVLGDQVCRIPSQVVIVVPAGGVAGPGTLILRTLEAAFASHGVAATYTRGRCPPGRGGEFFVTLACGGLQGACSSSSSSSSSAAGGRAGVGGGGSGGGGGGGQGFSVVVGSGMVRVAGTGEPGLFYGVRTFCQLFRFYARPSRAVAGESALGIPCCILRDEPDVVRRSLVLDVRYPLVPTWSSLMRTIEAASNSRMNVVQLTLTRETASWLARQDRKDDQGLPGATSAGAGREDGGSSVRAGENIPLSSGDKKSDEEGAWDWGALGAIGALCSEHFVELVLGWAVVPGDESREAQRSAVQLLSSLSRQFQSDEMHIVFEEGVQLTWGATSPEEPAEGRPEEVSRRPLAGGGSDPRRGGLLPGLSSGSFSEAGDAPRGSEASAAAPAAVGLARSREAGGSGFGLSLTRFLSNVVVACSQATIVLDGVPPAAVASLQEVGYLPVELAFSLGTDVASGFALAPLYSDCLIEGRSDELATLLGPAHLGYVCAGHRGPRSGRGEEACLSIRGALEDVAAAVTVARRTGCGVQLRVSTTAAPVNATVPFSPLSRHRAPAGIVDPAPCEGASLYYPALLSDALEFLGAGLCWRLDKASTALCLVPRECRIGEAGGGVTGRGATGERADRERGAAPVVAGAAAGVWPLQGLSDPAELLVAHVLRIDAGTMEAASEQLVSCLGMLLEGWNPFLGDEGIRGARKHNELATRKLDTVLWCVHAPVENGHLQLFLDDESRFLLRALQRRYILLEESAKLVSDTLNAAKATPALEASLSFLEIHRAARLLKISGRLLQASSNHFRRPDQGHVRGRSGGAPPEPPLANGDTASAGTMNGNGTIGRDEGGLRPRNLGKLLAQLSSSTRLDFANRYLEEFRALSASWDSTKHLSMGKIVLHASLSGLLRMLAYDEPAKQMETLCKHAIFSA
eukprot:g2133.t1